MRFLGLVFLLAITGCTDNSKQVATELNELKAKVAAMEELQVTIARKSGLGALVRPAAVPFEEGFVLGNVDAPIVIMEFTDLQCPFCKTFNEEVLPEIKAQLVDSGKVVFVSRDFPLLNTHNQAGYAAVALRCAREQVDYMAAKQYFYDNMGKLVPEDINAKIVEMGGNADTFGQCMQKPELHASVQHAFTFGMELGLSSTPSFLVGYNDGAKVRDFKVVRGGGTFEQFDQLVADLIAESNKK